MNGFRQQVHLLINTRNTKTSKSLRAFEDVAKKKHTNYLITIND